MGVSGVSSGFELGPGSDGLLLGDDTDRDDVDRDVFCLFNAELLRRREYQRAVSRELVLVFDVGILLGSEMDKNAVSNVGV